MSSLSTVKLVVDVVQGILTCLAILAGGSWTYYNYWYKREKFPKARTKLTVNSIPTPEGIYLSVSVYIKNEGNLLLTLSGVEIRVQQILPFRESYPIDYIQSTNIFGWPILYRRVQTFERNSLEIESDEEHNLCFDFLLEKHLRAVKIYAFINNQAKERHQLGWSDTLIYKLSFSDED